jgi:hypothetical protein
VLAFVTSLVSLLCAEREGDFEALVDYVSRNLEFSPKAGLGQDMSAMDRLFRGYAPPITLQFLGTDSV